LKQARVLAAKKAAVTPRGANVRIGNVGDKKQPTAFDGIENDPITTVRVAHFHGWNILRTGAVSGTQAAGGAQAAAAPVMSKQPKDLVAGKDYDWIEVTADMDPAEKRRARIANAKAKSAAVKALKASGAAAGPAPTAAADAPAGQQQAAPAAAVTAAPVGGEPVAGVDYEVIEITDDMDPADIRKARISNSKAKSAAMKAWKASGGVAAAAAEPAVEAAPVAAPAAQAAAAPSAALSSIPKPDLIDITDDMDPADIRKARINNAKAASAYKKALKEAGIDPSTVEI
jgi:putative ubiquitin-RnfH superfamily antitoxin RatB of RatAB toxin-antitoxin module